MQGHTHGNDVEPSISPVRRPRLAPSRTPKPPLVVQSVAVRVVGYVRVSTSEQADSGLGLEAQRVAITDEAKRRSWQLLEIYEDAGASAKTTARRPALAKAIEAVERGEADTLVVASRP